MENEPEPASALAWLWVIEALASFKEVNISLLHDIIETAPELPEGTGKNAREMVALRCLEGLFGSIDGITEDGSPAQFSKVTFDSSQSCEDVLQRILYETSESALTVGGPEMRKWDVNSFIERKRACMHCNLQQLKDSILDGTHPYVDFLMEKSGLASLCKRDSIPVNNDLCTELNRRLDNSSSDPQSQKEKRKHSPLLLEEERRVSEEDPSSFSLLPSKRSRIDFIFEDEARRLPGCDNVYINDKKLKEQLTHSLSSGEEAAAPHGTGVLEDSSERAVPLNERDDSTNLDEHQTGTLEESKLVKECFGSKSSGRCIDELHQDQSGLLSNTMTVNAYEGEEAYRVIGVEHMIDGTELPLEPKESNDSPVDGSLNKASTDDFKCDIRGHAKATNTMSHSGYVLNAVTADTYEEEKDASSDGEGFYKERIDIAMKKNEFISSQCTINHDSFVSVDGQEVVCMKCNKGGQLLSCSFSNCSLVVHEKCLGSSVRIDDTNDFYCPFCVCSLAISEYLEAKKKAGLTRKHLATFIHIGLGHQPTVIKERLEHTDLFHSRKGGVQDDVKICEDVDLGNKDKLVNPDDEYVNEVIDHQSTKVIDTEQIMKLSESFVDANSKHIENEVNSLIVAPGVLAVEEDGDGLLDQECQANAVVELEDDLKSIDQNDHIHNFSLRAMYILHADRGPVEAATVQEVLEHEGGDKEEEPVYALNIEGAESSDNDNDESIISNYSIRFRRQRYRYTCPATPPRRKKLLWTAEEEETLKEGVRKFSSSVERSPIIPWKKILEFGSSVFLKDRTSIDLKDKWRNLCKSPKFK